MKLQHLAIIFIIIIVPISFVLSEYLHIHIQTIEYQTQYDTRLMNATHDAANAFQINTANNRYSTVGNSKIRDIEASISTFYNSLGTSMGASGYTANDLHDYTPAILCTLYDGYYIYTKYYDTELKDYTYGLKPFITYSCRYTNKRAGERKYDIVVNYTLDNTITVIGTIDGKYITKTGHLITSETQAMGNEELSENLIILNDDGTYEKSKKDSSGILIPIPETFNYIIYNNQKVYKNSEQSNWDGIDKRYKYFTYSSSWTKNYLSDDVDKIEKIENDRGGFYSDSALKYYTEANDFTKWVNENLDSIQQSNAIDMDGNVVNDFTSDTGASKIFKTDDINDPFKTDSTFNEHRMNVIRRAIETNLVPAIASYNEHALVDYEFTMPKIGEEDWNKIENNVCFVSFLQGMPIKSKIYNNYSVIANNTNQESVGEDSIYIIDSNGEYHKPGCKKLIQDLTDNKVTIRDIGTYNNTAGAYQASDFNRKSVALTGEDASAGKQISGTDTNNTAFFYPQPYTACYDCIVNASDTYSIDDILSSASSGSITINNKKINIPTSLVYTFKKALARSRYDLYTVNGYLK